MRTNRCRRVGAFEAAVLIAAMMATVGKQAAAAPTFLHAMHDASYAARDALGNPAPLATGGAPAVVAGRYGNGLRFTTAGGDGLRFSATNSVPPASGTISLWFQPDFSSTDANTRILLEVYGGPNLLVQLCTLGGGVFRAHDGTSYCVATGITFAAGEWIRLGVTYEPGTLNMQLYVNGDTYTRGGGAGLTGTPDTFWVGCNDDDNYQAEGVIDNLYISDRKRDYRFEEIPADGNWPKAWRHRKRITIDSAQVDAVLTNFPVMVRLSPTNFDFEAARSDGLDVHFTPVDSYVALDYEREIHDGASGEGVYWVRLPVVHPDADTSFYMYYGNPTAVDGEYPPGVWENRYAGVWHLSEDPAGPAPQMLDSTSYGGNGTSYGNMTSEDRVQGYCGPCLDFDGVADNTEGDRVGVPKQAAYNVGTQMTVSAWAKRTAGVIICWQGQVSGANNTFWLQFNGATLQFSTRTANDVVKYATYSNKDAAAEWHYYVGTYNGATLDLYRDGMHVATENQSGALKWEDKTYYHLGIGHGVPTTAYEAWHFGGRIDEVRLSLDPRSPA